MPGDRDASRLFADVLSFGWVLPASIAAGGGLGWLGDRVLGTAPVLTLVLGAAGFAAGMVQIYREAIRLGGGGNPPRP